MQAPESHEAEVDPGQTQTAEEQFASGWDAASTGPKAPAADSASTSDRTPETAPSPDPSSAGGEADPEPEASSALSAEDTGTAGPPPSEEGPEQAENSYEDLKSQHEDLKKDFAKNEQELRAAEGRLRRIQTAGVRQQVIPTGTDGVRVPLSAAPRQPQEGAAAPPLAERLKGVRDVDPDLAESLEKVLTPFQAQLDETGRKLAERSEAEQRQGFEVRLAEVDQAVPGWREDIGGEEFTRWMDQQPGYRQAAFQQTDNPADLIEMLSSFRSSVNGSPSPEGPGREQADTSVPAEKSPAPSKRRAAQLASAAGVPSASSASAPKPRGAADSYDDGWNEAGREIKTYMNRQPRAANGQFRAA